MELLESNKKVQKLTIEILKVFIRICEENNLRYYFTGGALIGVLRHKGFVPWDDDIDVGMPRKDYERLLNILRKDMPDGYGICNRFTDSNWHFGMSQFIDLESEIVIHLAEEPRNAHIWVDIFPLDGLPSNKIIRWIWVKYILLHRYLVQIAHISTQVDANRNRPIYEKIILGILKKIPVGRLLNSSRILDHMEKILCKYDFYNSKYAGNMLGRYREREVVRQEYFGEPIKGQFENVLVNIPAKSHELQTALYGDYMQLPPEKDRVAHNVTILKSRD